MAETNEEAPITIWAMDCAFRKTGSPVMGTMGSSVKRVVLFEYDEWLRLAKRHPTIETQQFRVGSFGE